MRAPLLLLFVSCMVVAAQAQKPYYTGQGKVLLLDGTTVEGEIRFKPAYSKEVDVRRDSTEKWKTYTVKEAKSFRMDTLDFEPRIPRGGEVAIPGLEFMEVIDKTKTGLNIYMEHYQDKAKYILNVPLRGTEIVTFYVSVPGNTEEAYDLNSFKFIPKFDDKVSKIVEACPDLAKKIRDKEKGYFYNMMNQQKAPYIWGDIIAEYKKCVGGAD